MFEVQSLIMDNNGITLTVVGGVNMGIIEIKWNLYSQNFANEIRDLRILKFKVDACIEQLHCLELTEKEVLDYIILSDVAIPSY